MEKIICGLITIKEKKCCGNCTNFRQVGVIIGVCKAKKYKEKCANHGTRCKDWKPTTLDQESLCVLDDFDM